MQGAITPVISDVGSLDEAVRVHRQWLVRRLALVVRDVDEAEDLAQITFLRAAAAGVHLVRVAGSESRVAAGT